MLVMLAQVYAAQQALPQNRGCLFAAIVATLLARKEKRCDPAQWSGTVTVCSGLAQLAYAMQRASKRGTALDEAWAIEHITANGCPPLDLLYLATSATLLEWRDGTVRFVHQLVQEYFAALALHNDWTAGANLGIYWPQDWNKPSGWEETFILMAGLLPDMSALVDALRSVHPALAARCVVESGGQSPAPATQQRMQATLVTIAIGRRAPLHQRNAAGNALNHLGDSRPRVGLTASGLPDLVWCSVLADLFLLGNTKTTDDMASDWESPQRLYLSAFVISQYTITNLQFDPFAQGFTYQDGVQKHYSVSAINLRLSSVKAIIAVVQQVYITGCCYSH